MIGVRVSGQGSALYAYGARCSRLIRVAPSRCDVTVLTHEFSPRISRHLIPFLPASEHTFFFHPSRLKSNNLRQKMWSWMLLWTATLLPVDAMSVYLEPRHDVSENTTTIATASDGVAVMYVNTRMLVPGYFTFFLILYFVIATTSFTFVRFRTGMPLVFLILILIFPPSFLFLLLYLMVLRIGFLTAAWYIIDYDDDARSVNTIASKSSSRRTTM